MLCGHRSYDDLIGFPFFSLSDLLASHLTQPSSQIAQFLVSDSQALTGSMQDFADAWDPAIDNNYRNKFFITAPDSAISRILEGLSTLTTQLPLAVQGINASGATTGHPLSPTDTVSALIGIQNIYQGTYQNSDGSTISGASLNTHVGATNLAMAQSLQTAIANAVTASQQYTATPDTAALQALLNALTDVNQSLHLR